MRKNLTCNAKHCSTAHRSRANHVSRRQIINALPHMHARTAFTRGLSHCELLMCAARLQKRTGADHPSRIKKGMSAAVLFRRVSMNGLVSHGPNERAESGTQRPSAHVKCADNSIANGTNQRVVRQENAVLFSPSSSREGGRKSAIERAQKSTATHRFLAPAGSRSGGPSRHSVSCPGSAEHPQPGTLMGQGWALTNSGPSPSARARTPNAAVGSTAKCVDDVVGSTTEE